MDEFIDKLAAALKQEFGTMIRGDDDSDWRDAARGIASKMGVKCDPGTESSATRYYVEGIW